MSSNVGAIFAFLIGLVILTLLLVYKCCCSKKANRDAIVPFAKQQKLDRASPRGKSTPTADDQANSSQVNMLSAKNGKKISPSDAKPEEDTVKAEIL